MRTFYIDCDFLHCPILCEKGPDSQKIKWYDFQSEIATIEVGSFLLRNQVV